MKLETARRWTSLVSPRASTVPSLALPRLGPVAVYLLERRHPDGRSSTFRSTTPSEATFEEGVSTLDDPDTGTSLRIVRVAHIEGYAALLVCEPA